MSQGRRECSICRKEKININNETSICSNCKKRHKIYFCLMCKSGFMNQEIEKNNQILKGCKSCGFTE